MFKKLLLITLLLSSSLFASGKQWSPIHKEDGIEIFSLKSEAKSGVIPFKASGIIQAPLEKVVAVMKDDKKKPEWSPKLDKITMHKKLPNETYIFSEYYRTPWPATDREFLLKGTIKNIGKDQVDFSAKSIDNNFKSKDYIQTEVYFLNVSLKRIAAQQTLVEFSFHGDMKGWMPTWLMNLIQKKWPLRFIQGLRKASAK